MKERVKKALDKMRPILKQEGVKAELVDVDEDKGVVKVNLIGACNACPRCRITVEREIEKFLQKEIPGVDSVEEA
ncbi:MAG: NifU family protein [Nitrospiraceae bacterium]|nr:NifU family protein [Nitrospiraceae bacterium]